MDIRNLTDAEQTRLCELCEEYVIDGSAISSTFMCEGSFCESALPYLKEELEEKNDDSNI